MTSAAATRKCPTQLGSVALHTRISPGSSGSLVGRVDDDPGHSLDHARAHPEALDGGDLGGRRVARAASELGFPTKSTGRSKVSYPAASSLR